MRTLRIAVCVLVGCLALTACANADGTGASPNPSQTGGSTVTTPPASPDPTGLPLTPKPTGKPLPPSGSAGSVTLTGTVTSGVEPGCLLLDNHLLVGGPRDVLRAGVRVTVTGRVQPDLVTTCQQGTPLVVETARPA